LLPKRTWNKFDYTCWLSYEYVYWYKIISPLILLKFTSSLAFTSQVNYYLSFMQTASYNRNNRSSLSYTEMIIWKMIDYIISNHPLHQIICIEKQTKNRIETTHVGNTCFFQRNTIYIIVIVDLNRIFILPDEEAVLIRNEK